MLWVCGSHWVIEFYFCSLFIEECRFSAHADLSTYKILSIHLHPNPSPLQRKYLHNVPTVWTIPISTSDTLNFETIDMTPTNWTFFIVTTKHCSVFLTLAVAPFFAPAIIINFVVDTVSQEMLVAISKDESEPENVEYHFPISSGSFARNNSCGMKAIAEIESGNEDRSNACKQYGGTHCGNLNRSVLQQSNIIYKLKVLSFFWIWNWINFGVWTADYYSVPSLK